jgi:imidazole glycerol phosphate synthase subunit HisF
MPRVIVGLTIMNGSLYRTRKFGKPSYVGDPINAVHIFNEKGVDELVLLERRAEFEALDLAIGHRRQQLLQLEMASRGRRFRRGAG